MLLRSIRREREQILSEYFNEDLFNKEQEVQASQCRRITELEENVEKMKGDVRRLKENKKEK